MSQIFSDNNKHLEELNQLFERVLSGDKSIYFESNDILDLINYYNIENDSSRTLKAIQLGMERFPEEDSFKIELAHFYIETGKLQKAKQVIRTISSGEDVESVALIKARILLIEGKQDAAIKLLRPQLEGSISSKINAIFNLTAYGYFEEAKRWIDTIGKEYHEEEDYLDLCSFYYSSVNDFEKAEYYYDKLIDTDPYNAGYWLDSARCHFKAGNIEKTIEACDFALTIDDTMGDAYGLRGQCYLQLGNNTQAAEDFHRATEHKKMSPAISKSIDAAFLIGEQKWEEALQLVLEAIDESNDEFEDIRATLHTNAAICYYNLDDRLTAEYYFKIAHDIAPFLLDSYLSQAVTYLSGGEKKKSQTVWKIAAELSPFPETWEYIAISCVEFDFFTYAKTAFKKAKKLGSTLPDIDLKIQLTECLANKNDEINHLILTGAMIMDENEDNFSDLNDIEKIKSKIKNYILTH